jgi:hypothetical protein
LLSTEKFSSNLQDPAPVLLSEDKPDHNRGDRKQEQEELPQLQIQPADI